MTNIKEFLAGYGWGDAQQSPLQGDASSRRYIRLCSGPKRAMLMIDPQDDTTRFASMAHHLNAVGMSAPTVLAHEPGLMLIEDFGDDLFSTVIANNPTMEQPLYQVATDVLLHLEGTALPKDLDTATPQILGDMIEPFFGHYLPAMGVDQVKNTTSVQHQLSELLDTHLPEEQTLVLRDHHAENMIWLPNRDDIRRVGLLDFQDALIGPPIYDLVSMLQDARRDVSPTCVTTTLIYYAEHSGKPMSNVTPAYHLLGLQRNLRILGIFVRLAVERGKPSYLSLLPRVWAHVVTNLSAPVCRPLQKMMQDLMPEPTQDRLKGIKAQCQMP